MYLMKVMRKEGIPSIGSADTLDEILDLARGDLEEIKASDWEAVKGELRSRRRWSSDELGLTVTIAQSRG